MCWYYRTTIHSTAHLQDSLNICMFQSNNETISLKKIPNLSIENEEKPWFEDARRDMFWENTNVINSKLLSKHPLWCEQKFCWKSVFLFDRNNKIIKKYFIKKWCMFFRSITQTILKWIQKSTVWAERNVWDLYFIVIFN